MDVGVSGQEGRERGDWTESLGKFCNKFGGQVREGAIEETNRFHRKLSVRPSPGTVVIDPGEGQRVWPEGKRGSEVLYRPTHLGVGGWTE